MQSSRFKNGLLNDEENVGREELIWGKELYINSMQVSANADLDSLTPRFAVEAREAIQTHLAALFLDEDRKPEPQKAATEVVAATPEVTSKEVVSRAYPGSSRPS